MVASDAFLRFKGRSWTFIEGGAQGLLLLQKGKANTVRRLLDNLMQINTSRFRPLNLTSKVYDVRCENLPTKDSENSQLLLFYSPTELI